MRFLGYLEAFSAGCARGTRNMSYSHFANKELVRQAKEKNLDGRDAGLQSVDHHRQCHKIVRDTKK
jgi:hypothetical protein